MIRTNPRKKRTLGFKAKSLRGSAIIEETNTSDTSVASETSATDEPQLIRDTSAATTSSTTAATSTSFSSDKNPWQWHQMLKEAETVRRITVAQKLKAAEKQVNPIQQLVTESVQETKKANRFIVGLAKAQERLAEALILPEEKQDIEDEEDLLEPADDNLSDVEDLPEKLRTEEDDGTSVRSVAEDASSAAAAAEEKPKAAKSLLRRVPSCNDGSSPPVFSVTIPNVNASEETVYVLHKQHDVLQQTMARSIPSTKKIEELTEKVEAKYVPFGPSEVVQKLQLTEEKVQLLWGK